MKEYRYILEPYKTKKSRYNCPSCNHREKTFSRYIDKKTSKYLDENVGRCNREINCGYHYTPKQFFEVNKHLLDLQPVEPYIRPKQVIKPSSKPISFITHKVFKQSLKCHFKNELVKYLLELFGPELTNRLVERYCIGTSKHWPGATVFWQIDYFYRIRSGKIMLYDFTTGARIRKPHNHISWAHTVLKIKDFNLVQCFFGEHLLQNDSKKPVAIVESEKTAIIASLYLPQFTWLACGSLSNLSIEKCKVLSGRRVFLFPDLQGCTKWKQKAEEIQKSVDCKMNVSELLENNSSNDEKARGLDIADYLVKRDDKFGWALSKDNYPLFWDK